MLSFARKKLSRWLAIGLLGFVLIAMVITGFGTDGMGGLGAVGGGAQAPTTLAEVGDSTITEQEFSDILTRQFQQARQQQPTLDMATFLASGAFDQILNSMIVGAAVSEFGAEQGLVASQRMVDREIVNIPQFRNFAGQFDQATFRQALAGQNLTEAQLREDIARSLIQRQLLGPIALGGRVPEGLARQYANLLLERRQGTIGLVQASAFTQGINPSPAEVAQFYNQNRGRFMIPERRVVRFAMIGPDQIAAAAQATEQEIQAYYRQNAARYGPGETRTLQHLVLQDQRAAQAAVQQLRGGASFADVASRAGFAASDLTYPNLTQAAFGGQAAPEIAQAAFAANAAQGAVVGPIAAQGTFHVVRVDAIQRTPARSFQDVRAEIAQQITQRKAVDALAALIGRIEDRISDGSSLEEIAQAERLQLVTTPPLTAAGQAFGQPFVIPPELRPLITEAFQIDPENPEPVVEEVQPNQRYALLGIGQTFAAAPPPLAQIQNQVREVLIQQRALARARAVAEGIVGRLNGGTAAAQAFAGQTGVANQQSINMQRMEIARGGQQVPPPLLALFSLPQGRARIMPAPNGQGWFVVHHAQRTPGDASSQPQLIQTTRNEFNNSAAEELAQQFARALEQRFEVERNDEAIARVRRRLSGALQ